MISAALRADHRWLRLPRSATPSERFWAKVEKADGDGCWLWLASLDFDGYGQFRFGGRMVKAYAFAYVEAKGPIPAGLELDHLCRNRACVRPHHLEPVTHAENVRRGAMVAANQAVRP